MKNILFEYRTFLLVLLLISCSYAEQARFKINASESWGELPHFWSRVIGTGHAGLILDSALQDHIRDGVENLGIQGVRQHGTFHDDVGIYSEEGGEPQYSWDKFDKIYDFLDSLELMPILEMGFLPAELAEDSTRKIMNWGAVVGRPKNWDHWGELVEEVVRHIKNRYGEDLVDSMRFEVWNEPDLNDVESFWWGATQQDYFKLYKYAVEGARRAHITAKVGGPTPSGYGRLDWIDSLLQYTHDNDVPIDFVSYHTWHEYENTIGAHFDVLDKVKASEGYETLESINTEMGPTWQFGREVQPHETEVGAAFYAMIVSEISRRAYTDGVQFPFAYAWWVLSDVFEEGTYFEDRPFISCMGMITRQGVHKPIYNVFKMLHAMGDEQIEFEKTSGPISINGLASKHSDGSIATLFYNSTTEHNPEVLWKPEILDPFPYEPFDDEIEVEISGITFDTADVTIVLVDEKHSNAYTVWEDNGRPDMVDMDKQDWEELYEASVLDTLVHEVGVSIENGIYSKDLVLAREGVILIIVSPQKIEELSSSSEVESSMASSLESSNESSSLEQSSSVSSEQSSADVESSSEGDNLSSSDITPLTEHHTSYEWHIQKRQLVLTSTELSTSVVGGIFSIWGNKIKDVNSSSGMIDLSSVPSGVYVFKSRVQQLDFSEAFVLP